MIPRPMTLHPIELFIDLFDDPLHLYIEQTLNFSSVVFFSPTFLILTVQVAHLVNCIFPPSILSPGCVKSGLIPSPSLSSGSL
jgi:hypothetical protein